MLIESVGEKSRASRDLNGEGRDGEMLKSKSITGRVRGDLMTGFQLKLTERAGEISQANNLLDSNVSEIMLGLSGTRRKCTE